MISIFTTLKWRRGTPLGKNGFEPIILPWDLLLTTVILLDLAGHSFIMFFENMKLDYNYLIILKIFLQ